MDRHAWDQRYAGDDLVWKADPNQFLVHEVADLPPGRALDLACGEGRNAVWLARKGWDVTGVDFSAKGLLKAQRLAEASTHATITWIEDDVVTWAPQPDAFDLVLVFYVHLRPGDRRRMLGHATSAMAPGATLLLVGHDRSNLTEGVGGPQDPEILLDADEVVADLVTVDGSLVVERATQVHRIVETDDGERRAIDTLVRARRP